MKKGDIQEFELASEVKKEILRRVSKNNIIDLVKYRGLIKKMGVLVSHVNNDDRISKHNCRCLGIMFPSDENREITVEFVSNEEAAKW